MTRKDYVAIAKVFYHARQWIHTHWDEEESGDELYAADCVIDEIEWHISKVFERDNPRFDKTKFLEAGQPEQLELDLQ